ncbi:histidine kinase [Oceanidesulfovibrio indonesiensis]|uniref:histidine kinase n=1 Tax=Oceanidesulfovibrio indonesiensis TaxID=54767 RepID=A0A7M3MKC6_9BACT|nr:DUF3365 domain-containing protein [Oceanidesulfovibrio indonesiensis]TVM19881.1 histidine kinase [Oceanidesulfovibrio indonesiensis]
MKSFNLLKHQSLQAKFLFGLAAIILFGGLIFAGATYYTLHDLLESEVAAKGELVLAQAEAVQDYVRHTLRPAMYEALGDEDFIIEAMSSSYISRRVMENVGVDREPFIYRRAAINARNPNFEASELDRELIGYFQQNPGMATWSGYKDINDVEHYVTAHPVEFQQSCLRCHGDPSDSPHELIERYGAERGFGHTAGEIAGVTALALPVARSVSSIRGAAITFISLAVGGAVFYFAVANLLFNRLVVHSLRRAADVFPRYFPDDKEAQNLTRSKLPSWSEPGDEIEEALSAMESLASHLAEARKELTLYATDLERMVDERTEALSLEAGERRSDVRLFVRLLELLNESRTRRELIRHTLPVVARRFHADRAVFMCTVATRNEIHWPNTDIVTQDTLSEEWRRIVETGEGIYETHRAIVPVQSAVDALEGILCLYWDDADFYPEKSMNVLGAIGRQLGVSMENLNALDSLLRQNELLQAIIEGITDPLLLVDGRCNVVLANQAARMLTQDSIVPPEDERACLCSILGGEMRYQDGSAMPRGTALEETLHRGVPSTYELTLPEGRTFAVSLYPLPALDDMGDRRVVVYARETTAERRMLASLQQHEKLITVGRLAAGLAHEINNPLGIIHCYAELLMASATDDQQQADAQVILEHTHKAQKVLQDLLNFARSRKPGHGPCHPGLVAQESAEVFSVQAEKNGVIMKTAVEPELPSLRVDSQALEQIISNLVLNALDAVSSVERPGEITVGAGMDEQGVYLQVSDNGPGVSDDIMDRIFDPFFTTKEVGKGTGLGLAVVYGLAQELGGEVQVEPVAEGPGAVFTLRLPGSLLVEAEEVF